MITDTSFFSPGKARSGSQSTSRQYRRRFVKGPVRRSGLVLIVQDKSKLIKDVSQLVLSRRTRMCNFLEYKGMESGGKGMFSWASNRLD